ncbi:MAG: Ig-like domain-containing protein [Bacillus subtilis]|nr:Ig-like domain-containing protein [Bacillus subtilis]
MLKGTEQSIRANHDAFDIKPLVYLYQTTIVSYSSSNPEVLTVDANGIVVGHRFGSATVTVSLANGTVEEIRFRVKADVSTGTILLAAVVPFVVTGMGFLMIFFKPNHLDFLKKIAIFREKGVIYIFVIEAGVIP